MVLSATKFDTNTPASVGKGGFTQAVHAQLPVDKTSANPVLD